MFGVLNMLVSTSSFLPIIIVGPISDLIGTTTVIFIVGLAILAAGVASVVLRAPFPETAHATADPRVEDPIAAALGHDRPRWRTDDAPSSPVPAAPPSASTASAAARADDDPDADEPPTSAPARRTLVDAFGPADPADRD